MSIVPNTTIRILKDVPLDNTYKDTLYFANRSTQQTYFSGKTKYTLSNYTYQRQTKSIRVGISSENLFDCNYIMFRNTSFGTKWFYGFITQVEYINNGVSDITFETDVMQTWFYDCTLKHSFVEREHSKTDEIGDNLIEEQLELGEYVHQNSYFTGLMQEYVIIVASTFFKGAVSGDYVNARGGLYSNIFSGLYFTPFNTYSEVASWIENAGSKVDGIVSVFMMPKTFVPYVTEGEPYDKDAIIDREPVKVPYSCLKNTTKIDGYTPKNKKLLTHPFNFLSVTNMEGQNAEYPFEEFSTENCQFELGGDVSCNPQVILVPKHFRGASMNYNENLILDKFPQCAFNTDSYKAWLAQSASSLGLGIGGSVVGSMFGAMAAKPVALVGGIIGVGSTLAKIMDSRVMPHKASGSSGSGVQNALRIKDFRFSTVTIKEERAKIIDEFFSMYGYATKRVKIPNISSRPHWNYVKTIDCNIVGSVPVDSMGKIKSVFDKGVTFWKNGNNVGNYGLNNSV